MSAQAGARALRAGGNAVDAALAAMLMSFVAEPLLTGLGAGGYMLVAGAGREPLLLDFFVAAPSAAPAGVSGAPEALYPRGELLPVEVSFGDAVQTFHVGAASAGVYGAAAGVCEACRRWGTLPLSELVAPAARAAREGVALNEAQGYVARILTDLLTSTPECASLWAPGGRPLAAGDLMRDEELCRALLLLGREGDEPFYRGEVAQAVADWVTSHGGTLSLEDLRAYRPILRAPVRVTYRGREVYTNPPPSAGGILLAYSLALLDAAPSPPGLAAIVAAMAAAQARRTPEFIEGLSAEGFGERFLASLPDDRALLGSTTHISAIDEKGLACSVTCSNGEGSGVVVPGTGIHLNNMMGEEDLNPLGFDRHPPGRRMPSMMAPTLATRGGEVELVLGSAGSNRIRSALLQAIVALVDHGCGAQEAITAPRVHYEDGILFAEPGVEVSALEQHLRVVRFTAPNLYFGGVQAALRRDGELSGAGDPRRGGAAVAV